MKKLIFGTAAILFACGIQAQNQNVTDVSKTTVTTVKDSDGEKKLVKSENTKQVQNIELQDADSKALNKDVKPSAVQVISSTTVTGPDGQTTLVDMDRSAYYSYGDHKLKLALDPSGYTVTTPTGTREAVVRRTSNNNYIYRTKDRTSIGYFDRDGNFVLDTYDDKTDKITTEIYKRNP